MSLAMETKASTALKRTAYTALLIDILIVLKKTIRIIELIRSKSALIQIQNKCFTLIILKTWNFNCMPQIHKPSRTQSLIFFFFTVALAIGILLWSLVLNKGTLLVEGEFPLRVQAGSNDIACNSAPCILKLKPSTYNVTIRKEGFFDDVKTVKIARFSEVKIFPNLRFIPFVREVGDIILPVPNAPLRSPFLGVSKLENWPSNAKEATFSASGAHALLTLGREVYLYSVKEKSLKKTPVPLDTKAAWAGENIVFLEKKDAEHVLKYWLKKGDTAEVVSFERPFSKSTLFGDVKDTYVLIMDTANNKYTYYLVDLAKQSRKRLAVSEEARAVKWAAGLVIFEDGKRIFAVNPETLEKIELPAADVSNVIEMRHLVLLFLSTEKQDRSGSIGNVSIEEAIEEAKQQTVKTEQPTSLFITELDRNIDKHEYKTIATIPVKHGEEIRRFTSDTDKKRLYFEKGGKLFEVVLE